jgi:FAD:protein FMN transferase
VNFSGNFRVGDAPTDREGWPVAIDSLHESDSTKQPLFALRLARCAIATSGDRWQKLPDARSKTNEDRTSHILDPQSGFGIVPPQSVSIISSLAANADAAATATCVHLLRDGKAWIRKLESLRDGYCGVIQQSNDGQTTVETFGAFERVESRK